MTHEACCLMGFAAVAASKATINRKPSRPLTAAVIGRLIREDIGGCTRSDSNRSAALGTKAPYFTGWHPFHPVVQRRHPIDAE